MLIRTRFEGATNTKGARIVAYTEGKQKTVPYDYSRGIGDNHSRAAESLFKRLHPESREHTARRVCSTRSLRGYVVEVTFG